MQFASATPEDTHALGVRLGRLAQPGDVLLFQGELGSGKTVLAQGVGEGLAVQQPVTSSSYVLMAEYDGRLTLYHADLFRLDDPAPVAELAPAEVAAAGLLIGAWPERAGGCAAGAMGRGGCRGGGQWRPGTGRGGRGGAGGGGGGGGGPGR